MRLRFPSLPRPALKTLTQSLMHFAAAAIGMIEPLVQAAACMLHERVRARADQGAPPEAALGL